MEFQYIRTDRVQSFLNMLTYSNYTGYYESSKITSCKHNFIFGEEGRIYLGIVPNWKKEDRHDKNIILEYNPNKVDPFMINELSWLKTIPRDLINVMSIDFAVDMGVPYSDVRMLKRDKREYMCNIGHSEVETRYLGELGHNHVKLYNKAKEQKLDVDWTRFEITCKKINSLGCSLKEFQCLKIPIMYLVDNQLSLEYQQLNDITRIVFESIVNDTDVLYTIKHRGTRKKYENLLQEFLNPVDINVREMHKAYIEYSEQFTRDLDKSDDIDFKALIKECSKTV